jgi:hypothetical protein
MGQGAETEHDEPDATQEEAASFVLSELTRQLNQQSSDISTVRSRATGLLSAAGVVNGIFGFTGIASDADQSQSRVLAIIALLAFALMVASLLPALIPRKFDLRGDLVHHVVRLGEGIRTRSLDVAISLATSFDRMIKSNAPKIDGLYWCITVGAILLAAQVLLWTARMFV